MFKGKSTVAKSLFWKMWTSSKDRGVKSTVTINRASVFAGITFGLMRDLAHSVPASEVITFISKIPGTKGLAEAAVYLSDSSTNMIKPLLDKQSIINPKRAFKNIENITSFTKEQIINKVPDSSIAL
ncbi:MAG: hypothetical protein PHE78_06460, partial [Candidatus Gastranaerophilales bacterium]|nr:hypothetical protein [Candidatus Gastranaerophilales bacterium]